MQDDKPIVFLVGCDETECKSTEQLISKIGLSMQTFHDPQDFLDAYDPKHAGCLIVNMQLPKMSGLELHRKLIDKGLYVPTIIIMECADIPITVEAIRAGVVDFFQKPIRDQLLLDAVNKAIQQDARSRRGQAFRVEVEAKAANLTLRERDIANLLIAGKSSKRISYELGISVKTVSFHRANILEKMGVDSVIDLLLLACKARGGQAANSMLEWAEACGRRRDLVSVEV